jgi:Flp pilus assembly protein TadD
MKRIAVLVLFFLLAIPAFCAKRQHRSAKALARKHFKLSVALWEKYDDDKEIAELRKALALDPNFAEAHFNLGVALAGKNEFDEAAAEFRRAARLVPRDHMAHHCLALALEKKGNLPGALNESKVALRLDPKNEAYKQNYQHLLGTRAPNQVGRQRSVGSHPALSAKKVQTRAPARRRAARSPSRRPSRSRQSAVSRRQSAVRRRQKAVSGRQKAVSRTRKGDALRSGS